MYSKLLAIAAAGILMTAGTAWAQSSTVKKTPGHMMQNPPGEEYRSGSFRICAWSPQAQQIAISI